MKPEEFEAWLMNQPLLLAYIGLLLVGSLISFIILLVRVSQPSRLERNPVPPWTLSSLDFAVFVLAAFFWFLISGYLVLQVFWWAAGKDADPTAEVMVIGGFLLQAGLLYLFLFFRHRHRNPLEGPLSPRIQSLGQSLFLGFFYFLACLPVVYGVGAIWNGLLEFLRSKGHEIDLPLQDAVVLFKETDNPLTFFSLLLLAVVIAPIVEEAVFRAGIFRYFKGRSSLVVALFISGLCFGLIHGNLQSLPGLVTVGVCLGLAYELSGNLKVPIFFHAFFNLNSIIWILIIPESITG